MKRTYEQLKAKALAKLLAKLSSDELWEVAVELHRVACETEDRLMDYLAKAHNGEDRDA